MTCENCNREAGQLELTPAGPRCLCKQCRTGTRTQFRRGWQRRRGRREVLSARARHRSKAAR